MVGTSIVEYMPHLDGPGMILAEIKIEMKHRVQKGKTPAEHVDRGFTTWSERYWTRQTPLLAALEINW